MPSNNSQIRFSRLNRTIFLIGASIALALCWAPSVGAQVQNRRFLVDLWSDVACKCNYNEIDPHTFQNPVYSAESRNDRGRVTDFYVNATATPSRHLDVPAVNFTDPGKIGSKVYVVTASLWCAQGYLNRGEATVKVFINGHFVAEDFAVGAAGLCGADGTQHCDVIGTNHIVWPGPYDP